MHSSFLSGLDKKLLDTLAPSHNNSGTFDTESSTDFWT